MLRNETSFLWKEGDREAVEVGSQALFLEEGARRAGDGWAQWSVVGSRAQTAFASMSTDTAIAHRSFATLRMTARGQS